MQLETLSVTDFRCFEALDNIALHRLTIFIGENDVGKTVLIDAVQHLLTMQSALPEEYRRTADNTPVPEFTISGTFTLDTQDTLPANLRTNHGLSFKLRKILRNANPPRFEVFRASAIDGRFDEFENQTAAVQRELLESIGVDPGNNGPRRIEQFQDAEARDLIPSVERYASVNFRDIAPYLPRFSCVSSADYRHPDTVIQKTLQESVDLTLRPQVGEVREELAELRPVRERIQTSLNARVAEIEGSVRGSLPTLRGLRVESSIDFSRSVAATSLLVDTGEGYRTVEALGEGNKKKLRMGLLEWQRATEEAAENINAIRAYDEPDINLHYDAQRKLYTNMVAPIANPANRVQVIISTHSIQLIDRAPVEAINLVRMGERGGRNVARIEGDTDQEFFDFFGTLSKAMGLTNSALFYERAFLLVEGPSEENALPKLYANVFGHPMLHDGIVLINLEGCGSWKTILKVLQRNKQSQTIALLDQDCSNPGSSGYMTRETLLSVGYSADFIRDNCHFVGVKEFEDSFRDDELLAVMNQNYQREDGLQWVTAHLPNRDEIGGKFSASIIDSIKRHSVGALRQRAKKPDFAELLANQCLSVEQIPLTIRNVFDHCRQVSGVAAGGGAGGGQGARGAG